jgi:hypothetical protein
MAVARNYPNIPSASEDAEAVRETLRKYMPNEMCFEGFFELSRLEKKAMIAEEILKNMQDIRGFQQFAAEQVANAEVFGKLLKIAQSITKQEGKLEWEVRGNYNY